VLIFHAASHCDTFNVVVVVNVGVFRDVEAHVGAVQFVVYFIVQSVAVHVGAILLQ